MYVLFITGDREAETMLSAIWDNISQDDNPDDLGQMRDILGKYSFHANDTIHELCC
jgi:hypothetical protein